MHMKLLFGAGVMSGDSHIGTLEKIIVNNGVANQVTVDPGLLGYERVVPISAFSGQQDDTLTAAFSPEEWKSFPSLKMDVAIDNPSASEPDLSVLSTDITMNADARDTEHPLGAHAEELTVDQMSMQLSTSTVVVNDADGSEHALKGITIDTGRIQTLIVDSGELPFAAVSQLDQDRIHVNGNEQQPVLDADRDTV